MDEEKSLTKNNKLVKPNQNQGRQFWCGSIKHLQITSDYCPVGISYQRWGKLALGVGISPSKTTKAAEDAAAEEEVDCLVLEASGVDEESD